MPTYEYQCDACGHTFDEFQQISDKPLRTCPECGKRKLQRLIGAGAAVIFKGNGFYQTDYRSGDYAARAKAESKESCSSSCPAAKSCPAANKAGSKKPSD